MHATFNINDAFPYQQHSLLLQANVETIHIHIHLV